MTLKDYDSWTLNYSRSANFLRPIFGQFENARTLCSFPGPNLGVWGCRGFIRLPPTQIWEFGDAGIPHSFPDPDLGFWSCGSSIQLFPTQIWEFLLCSLLSPTVGLMLLLVVVHNERSGVHVRKFFLFGWLDMSRSNRNQIRPIFRLSILDHLLLTIESATKRFLTS